ncbi:hypothetical protein JX265_012546 [Neoarthrinium moseri]|uniref:Uncharacterized protein n=1 Tax=Neoarthrinium moseri TaxID=1658444 RepID=A0A9P9WAQ0_9PEZI|nr:hypothetical protein JX265_012546 [Neoarthrinium moseri]
MDGDLQTDATVELLTNNRYKRLDSSYVEALNEAKKHPPKFYFEGCFHAWFLFYSAKRKSQASPNFSGKSELTKLVRNIESRDDTQLRSLACYVQQQLSDEVQQNINEVSDYAAQRRRTAVGPQENVSADSQPESESEAESVHNDSPIPEPNGQGHKTWHESWNACLDGLTSLFPQSFSDVVSRMPHPTDPGQMVAAARMALPVTPQLQMLGSQMSIDIIDSANVRLAKDLFGVDLEVDATGVCVAYPGGAKIRPTPALMLETEHDESCDYEHLNGFRITCNGSAMFRDDECGFIAV